MNEDTNLKHIDNMSAILDNCKQVSRVFKRRWRKKITYWKRQLDNICFTAAQTGLLEREPY